MQMCVCVLVCLPWFPVSGLSFHWELSPHGMLPGRWININAAKQKNQHSKPRTSVSRVTDPGGAVSFHNFLYAHFTRPANKQAVFFFFPLHPVCCIMLLFPGNMTGGVRRALESVMKLALKYWWSFMVGRVVNIVSCLIGFFHFFAVALSGEIVWWMNDFDFFDKDV